jgi:putative holliday junction resolvase
VRYRDIVSRPYRCQGETWLARRAGERCRLAAGHRLRTGVRLGVDVGSARIGIARCDGDGSLASPLTTVRSGRGDLEAIARMASADGVIEIIVGLPLGLSGREGRAAAGARAFAARLARRVAPVPVRLVDERFTTVIAHDALRRSGSDAIRRRPRVDQAAAALLLQGALDLERSTGRPAGELVSAPPGGDG